ncbi:MAG: 3 beta-hydroxysteroid dehydrogenase/Delta 5--_4-isomerase [Gemmataceae bacterium]|nr:3 beta-hydroxysteroid dehydrogenase/Delta 5-->4-isomerase [Gemmataceae bacterium]
MKILLVGGSGTIGQRVLAEAVKRGHAVTSVTRDPSRVPSQGGVTAVKGDALDPKSLADAASGHDAVVSAYSPGGQDPSRMVDAARAQIAGLKQAGVKRLIVVGGAGSLEVAPGVQVVDTPEFPAAWKDIALAHRDALEVYRKEGGALEWTYFSPPALIEPGERTGTFRVGSDQLLVDAAGQSRISAEDYAIALLDEVETPKHVRKRFTAAY